MQYTMEQWDNLLANSVAKIKELSKLKGGEYAGNHDRLANFRDEAKALDLPMETIWCIYVNKHWCAVKQYVKDLQHGTTRPRMESINGRLDDIIVYSLLFKAMIEEREGFHQDALPPGDMQAEQHGLSLKGLIESMDGCVRQEV
jgi:hypothetical protein